MQKDAVLSLLGSDNDLIVVLPTAGGKTLLCYMQAKAFPRAMTIVVVPFTALLEETLEYCVGQGISAIEWKHGVTSQHTMVLVSAELAVSLEFLGYAQKARLSNLLNMVVFDEVYTILKDAGWRQPMSMLHRLSNIAPRRMLLSGTMPPSMEQLMQAELNMKHLSTFRASTARPQIAYSVHVLPDDNFDEVVLSKVIALVNELAPDSKVIVFGGMISACEMLAERLNAFLYHAHLGTKSELL